MKGRMPWIGALLLATALSAQTRMEDVHSFTLDNGMKFLVIEDHSIPNANYYCTYKVGSRNEYPGITGLSHFFEHMMFNGAKKYGFKQFDRVMEAAGGANNAWTSKNLTAYTDWFPTEAIETIFDLESDRMANLAFVDSVVESERGVILSERITGMENTHFSFLDEQVCGVAYIAHPYSWSVVGHESDIRNWEKEDLVRYWSTYYAPNNCVAVVVGDVQFEQVKSLAEAYFGPIPGREPPRPVHTVEPEQLGEKRIEVHRDVNSPYLEIVWHVPETRHADYFALDILDDILSSGRSSRLYRALVEEKQVAVNFGTGMEDAFDPTVYQFMAVCAQGKTPEDLEAALYEEIERMAAEGPTAQELQKVKNRKLAGFYRQMETINGRASGLGRYEIIFGDYRKLYTAPQAYEAVTAQDIQRVAATYFKKSNRTVGVLKPAEEES